MTWSAVKIAIDAPGSIFSMTAAEKATALRVSLPIGSARRFSGGRGFWLCFANDSVIDFARDRLVQIQRVCGEFVIGIILSIAILRRDWLPGRKGMSCLGAWGRLMGQSRVPLPPAMMIACRMVWVILDVIEYADWRDISV